MEEKAKRIMVVVDAMGSDNGPVTIVKGACQALEDSPDLDICLVGDEAVIKAELKANGAPMDRVKVVGSTDVITNYDHPVMAIQRKTDSSLCLVRSRQQKP